MSYFKKSYQSRNDIAKNEKSDSVSDCHSILARLRKYFSHLLKVHGVNDVRQTVIHTAETLVSEPNAFEFELVTEKLISHKSQGIDQIPAELIKAGVEQLAMTFINLLFLFGIRRHCLRSGSSRSL